MTQEPSQLVGELGLRAHPNLPHSRNIITYLPSQKFLQD